MIKELTIASILRILELQITVNSVFHSLRSVHEVLTTSAYSEPMQRTPYEFVIPKALKQCRKP